MCYETFGIIVLEAFRDRVPVVVRDLGPLGEIVRQSGGGLVFETAEELRTALERLARDADLREKLSASGHRALQERWSESVVIRSYFDLIRRVAERRGDRGVLERLPAEYGPGPGGET